MLVVEGAAAAVLAFSRDRSVHSVGEAEAEAEALLKKRNIASPLEPLYQSRWVTVVILELMLVIVTGGLRRMEETVCSGHSRHMEGGGEVTAVVLEVLAGPGEVVARPAALITRVFRQGCKIFQAVQDIVTAL